MKLFLDDVNINNRANAEESIAKLKTRLAEKPEERPRPAPRDTSHNSQDRAETKTFSERNEGSPAPEEDSNTGHGW